MTPAAAQAYDDVFVPAEWSKRELKGWMPLAGVLLSDEETARIVAEAERVLRPFAAADGTVSFASPAHIVAGERVA
jgi:hypothetical protein